MLTPEVAGGPRGNQGSSTGVWKGTWGWVIMTSHGESTSMYYHLEWWYQYLLFGYRPCVCRTWLIKGPHDLWFRVQVQVSEVQFVFLLIMVPTSDFCRGMALVMGRLHLGKSYNSYREKLALHISTTSFLLKLWCWPWLLFFHNSDGHLEVNAETADSESPISIWYNNMTLVIPGSAPILGMRAGLSVLVTNTICFKMSWRLTSSLHSTW